MQKLSARARAWIGAFITETQGIEITSDSVRLALLNKIRREIRAEAIKVLERFGKDDSVALQVEALIGSLDDTLSDEVILQELRAMNNADGLPFVEVFASVE